MNRRDRTKLSEAKPRLSVHDDVAYRTRAAAHDLRRRETESEHLMWEALRGRRFHGLKFRRQQAIGPFVVDFYCAELRLVIEIDGAVHDDTQQRLEDASRQQALESADLRVIRVRTETVVTNLSAALELIAVAITADSKLPSPLEGEGPGVRGTTC